ncbi:Pol polyprotein [Spraguea lophii 42_110]|uniref:Pol polyprotein n=1 Tax=Spraguea lophii (strain 42_110) TaxID=1358809 RepID=S7XFI2_SPRLO|nr:Pol polyprotein [Spraguea lophii 42_110]
MLSCCDRLTFFTFFNNIFCFTKWYFYSNVSYSFESPCVPGCPRAICSFIICVSERFFLLIIEKLLDNPSAALLCLPSICFIVILYCVRYSYHLCTLLNGS